MSSRFSMAQQSTDDGTWPSLENLDVLKPENCLRTALCDVCCECSVTEYCCQCEQWICSSCASLHAKFSATQSHKLTTASKKANDVFRGLDEALNDAKKLNERKQQQRDVEKALKQLQEVHESCKRELDAEYEKKVEEIVRFFPRYEESSKTLEKITSQFGTLCRVSENKEQMTIKMKQLTQATNELHKLTKTELSAWNTGSDEPLPTVRKHKDWTPKFTHFQTSRPPVSAKIRK